MFLFLLFLHFHSCSSFFPVTLFHLFYYLFYLLSLFSLSLGDDTKWPTRVDVSLNPNTISQSYLSQKMYFVLIRSTLSGHFYLVPTKWGRSGVEKCRVPYVTGASNWYWLTVGQGLLSLKQVRVEGECFISSCFFTLISVPFLPRPSLSSPLLSLLSLFSSRWQKMIHKSWRVQHNQKYPQNTFCLRNKKKKVEKKKQHFI